MSQPAVSEMVGSGLLPAGGTLREWLHFYCSRLRAQAAGRYTEGPLDLSQERAALAREQRIGVEMKNAALRGELAPISLLSEVLATASQSVVDRFEQIPGMLKKACPQLDDAARDQVMAALATARNEWVRGTMALVVAKLDAEEEPDLFEGDDEPRAD